MEGHSLTMDIKWIDGVRVTTHAQQLGPSVGIKGLIGVVALNSCEVFVANNMTLR